MKKTVSKKEILKVKMRFSFKILFFYFLALNNAFSKTLPNITILSEPDMIAPLNKIARLYSEESNSIISANFKPSLELIREIDDGEPGDVFISSHTDWIESLKRKGVIDVYSITNIAKNRLVLITSENNKKITPDDIKKARTKGISKALKMLSDKKIPLIIEPLQSSLGQYSKAIINNAGTYKQKIYYRIPEDKKSMTDLVKINNNSDGYNSGITLSSSIKKGDNIIILSEISNSEIYYQAVVVAGYNMDVGRDFLKFLKSDKAKKILEESGFTVE